MNMLLNFNILLHTRIILLCKLLNTKHLCTKFLGIMPLLYHFHPSISNISVPKSSYAISTTNISWTQFQSHHSTAYSQNPLQGWGETWQNLYSSDWAYRPTLSKVEVRWSHHFYQWNKDDYACIVDWTHQDLCISFRNGSTYNRRMSQYEREDSTTDWY